MDVVWDGITRVETLQEEAAQTRHALADAAKSYNWSRVLELLSEHNDLVNTTRPGGLSLYASLHQAAHGGAPIEVAQRLIGMLAWRPPQDARRSGHFINQTTSEAGRSPLYLRGDADITGAVYGNLAGAH